MTVSKPLSLILAPFSLILLLGCAPKSFTYRQVVMGVETSITLYANGEDDAVAAAKAAFARLDDLENAMSDYRAESELMRLAATSGVAVPVSQDLFEVLARAETVRLATDGAFDITAGPLTRLWRDARKRGELPTPDAIAAARAKVGGDAVALDAATETVTITRVGLGLDLGGIGKGFAAAKAIETLAALGHPQALVAIAGDVAAGAAPPGRDAWTVETSDGVPFPLVHASASTSGNAEQFLDVGGVRYSHILDLATGLGSTLQLEATVTGPDGAVVDALSSALVLRAPESGVALLAAFPGFEARIVEQRRDGSVRVTTTAGWPAKR